MKEYLIFMTFIIGSINLISLNAQTNLSLSFGSAIAEYELHEGFDDIYHFQEKWTKPGVRFTLGADHKLTEIISLGLDVSYADFRKREFIYVPRTQPPELIPKAFDVAFISVGAGVKARVNKFIAIGLNFKKNFLLKPNFIRRGGDYISEKSESFLSLGPFVKLNYKEYFIVYDYDFGLNKFVMDTDSEFFNVVKGFNAMSFQIGYSFKFR